jgi:putative ABC transport system substrate-binding protein
MAARGARAANDAGGGRSPGCSAYQSLPCGVPSGPRRSRLCRGAQRDDRPAFGGRTIRATPCLGGGVRPSQGRGIVALAPVSALAAKAATTTIPIVFELGSDPVRDGLVASLARPGGNITGVTFFANLLASKRILHDIVPSASVVGLLLNPKNANAELELSDAQAAARALDVRFVVVRAAEDAEIDTAFAELARQGVAALLVAGDAYLSSRRGQIAALALRHGIATGSGTRELADAGALVSYGADRREASRQCGLYVGRVLKGEKPGDLPVVQPTKFELVINLTTAKALGLTISRELLFRADEVIE